MVKIDQSQMDQLTAPTETVNVDTDEASAAVTELEEKIENLPEGKAKVDPETSTAMHELQNVEDKLNEVSGITATPTVTVSGNYTSADTTIS